MSKEQNGKQVSQEAGSNAQMEYTPTSVQFLKPIDCVAPGMERISVTMESVDKIEVSTNSVIIWPKNKALGYYRVPISAVAVIKYAQKQLP